MSLGRRGPRKIVAYGPVGSACTAFTPIAELPMLTESSCSFERPL